MDALKAERARRQDGWDADIVDCASVAEIGLDLIRLHVLGIPGFHRSCIFTEL